jgi:hypothetical protein
MVVTGDECPTFGSIVNLKTARALSIAAPISLLGRANEIIE